MHIACESNTLRVSAVLSTTPLAVGGLTARRQAARDNQGFSAPGQRKNWPVRGAFRHVKRPIWCDEGRTIPEPLAMIPLFGGVVGLGGYIRKRRMA